MACKRAELQLMVITPQVGFDELRELFSNYRSNIIVGILCLISGREFFIFFAGSFCKVIIIKVFMLSVADV